MRGKRRKLYYSLSKCNAKQRVGVLVGSFNAEATQSPDVQLRYDILIFYNTCLKNRSAITNFITSAKDVWCLLTTTAISHYFQLW